MKTLFLSLLTGLTIGSAIAIPAIDRQSFKKKLEDAFGAVETHCFFTYNNINKCVDGRAKRDCFSAINDVQTAKKILKNEKNISNYDEDLTAFQCYLLRQLGNTATVEDVLRFWVTPLGEECLEDAQKYGLIPKD